MKKIVMMTIVAALGYTTVNAQEAFAPCQKNNAPCKKVIKCDSIHVTSPDGRSETRGYVEWSVERSPMTDKKMPAPKVAKNALRTNPVKVASVHGAQLPQKKGFFFDIKHGRPLTIGIIKVQEMSVDRYIMTAVINGRTCYEWINKKTYEKFLCYDDQHRLLLFDKVFKIVKIKGKKECKAKKGCRPEKRSKGKRGCPGVEPAQGCFLYPDNLCRDRVIERVVYDGLINCND